MSNSNFSQEDLSAYILRARNGSQESFQYLRSKYAPLIESQVLKHKLADMSPQDVEDLRQEAVAIFCNAICTYDLSSVEVEFGLYAKICIQNGLISVVRTYLRRKKSSPVSLDDKEVAEKNIEEIDFLQFLVNKENMAELVRVIGKNLSDYENRVWWMYVSGMAVSDIAKSLGDPPKSVSNAIYRIRKKLREFLSERNNLK